MGYPKKVKLVEVGPRDGLQNESRNVSVDLRVNLINQLSACGFPVIEAGSFVSPKWVPQMANTIDVLSRIDKNSFTSYPVLVPNLRGLEEAIEADAKEIAIFGSATEGFSHRNINCSIAASLKKFEPIVDRAIKEGIKIRGYISVVLGCPVEGEVHPEKVADVAKALMDMGCYEISLGDTIGMGTPTKVQRLLDILSRDIQVTQIAGHFHDTYGQALANIFTSLQYGVSTFDCSVAGLGGCPFAGEGASGNVATEDVLFMLNGMDIETGIDINKLVSVGEFVSNELEKPSASKAGRALLSLSKVRTNRTSNHG